MADNFELNDQTGPLTWNFIMQNLQQPDLLRDTYQSSRVDETGEIELNVVNQGDAWGVPTSRNVYEDPILNIRGGKYEPGPYMIQFGNIQQQFDVKRRATNEASARQRGTIVQPAIGPQIIPERPFVSKHQTTEPGTFQVNLFPRLGIANGLHPQPINIMYPNNAFPEIQSLEIREVPGNPALHEDISLRVVIATQNSTIPINTEDIHWAGVIGLQGNFLTDIESCKLLTVYEEKLLPRLPLVYAGEAARLTELDYGKGKAWSVPGGKSNQGDPIIQALLEFIEEATQWRSRADWYSQKPIFELDAEPEDDWTLFDSDFLSMDQLRNNARWSITKENTDPGINPSSVPLTDRARLVKTLNTLLYYVVSVCTVSGSGLMYLVLDLDKLFAEVLDKRLNVDEEDNYLDGFFDDLPLTGGSITAEFFQTEGIQQRAAMLETIPTLYGRLDSVPDNPEENWWINIGGGYSLRQNMFNVASVIQTLFGVAETRVPRRERRVPYRTQAEERELNEDSIVRAVSKALQQVINTQDADVEGVIRAKKSKVFKKGDRRHPTNGKKGRYNKFLTKSKPKRKDGDTRPHN
jgi:hypothetical protein